MATIRISARRSKRPAAVIIAMKADLSKPTKALTDEIVAEVVKVYGHLDILLNNAGVNRRAPFLEYAEADWDYTLNLNLKQVFLLSQSAANQMVKQGTRGKIINIASMLSFTGGILVPAYTASKSAIMGLTKEMANELSSKDINVNAIAPGYMKTPLTQAMQDDPVRNKEVLRPPADRLLGRSIRIAGTGGLSGQRSFRLYLRRDDSSGRRLAGSLIINAAMIQDWVSFP